MSWYDRPDLYDVAFGYDPITERDFVLGASERWGRAAPRRILEPFCGTGRLLRLMPGLAAGFDLNPGMVRFAARHGCAGRVFRADAGRFALAPQSFDLAFNLIDSFRHLADDGSAAAHLAGVARALRPGAVYVLGLDINGDLAGDVGGEDWTEERDGVTVRCRVEGLGDSDPVSRFETLRVRLDVERAGRRESIEEFLRMRVYTRRQFADLVDSVEAFEFAAVFRRAYDLERPVELTEVGGSAIVVLRRT